MRLSSAHDAIPRLTKHTPFFGCLAQASDFDAAHLAAASRTIISHFARLAVQRSGVPLQLGRRDMLFVESGELQLVSNDRSTAALTNRKASNHPQPVLKTCVAHPQKGENEEGGLPGGSCGGAARARASRGAVTAIAGSARTKSWVSWS
jgi:hypothetical protein